MSNLKLYKAKRKFYDEWIESVSINFQTDINGNEHIYMGLPVKTEQYPKMTTIEWTEVIPESVIQLTGVNDKNGKPIWQHNECRLTMNNASHDTAKGYIDFINGSYVFIEYIYRTVVLLSELSNKGYEIEVVIDWYDEELAKVQSAKSIQPTHEISYPTMPVENVTYSTD